MEQKKCLWGLLRRRQCLVPTWRGWLALVLSLGIACLLAGRNIHRFLAVTHPVPAQLLVVEGWVSDYALKAAITEFTTNHYTRLLVVGGPLEHGAPLSEYETFAQIGAATLIRLGLDTNVVQAVPAPEVRQDRTYAAAVALRDWLQTHRIPETRLNLLTEGPHARRSWLLFKKALGKQYVVGIVSVSPREYDPEHWWRYSAGVRNVISETVAYGYARVLFRAPKPPPNP